MSSNNKQSLYEASQKYAIRPNENVWLKLEAKLEKSRQAKRINRYKILSIAALFIAVCAVVTLMYYHTETLKNNQNSSLAAQAFIYHVTDFNAGFEDGIYDTEKLKHLHHAYQQLHQKSEL